MSIRRARPPVYTRSETHWMMAAPQERQPAVGSPRAPGRRHGPLTGMELTVLRSFARWDTTSEIAEAYELCESTITSHTKSIFRKLGVRSRSRAIVIALCKGLVTLSELVDGPCEAAE